MDGAAGKPLPVLNNRTCLEAARTPDLDEIVKAGRLGLARTVPPGMEPSSACACMSVMGYDPKVYYRGRSAIEAKSMGIPIGKGEIVFRCNLVSLKDGKMHSYSAGHISTPEAKELIEAVQEELGSDELHFYPGVNYRHILKIKGHQEILNAVCTPPHDIANQPVDRYLPGGQGGDFLLNIMRRSESVLSNHPVNKARVAAGKMPATTIWLFWGSGQIPEMPPFPKKYGLRAAMTSAVDLLRGLAIMSGIDILEIPDVTDGPDNNFAGQGEGAIKALEDHDLVFIHVEAPDEAGHAGSHELKISAIEKIDREILGRLRGRQDLKIMVMPDHPTPVQTQTHNGDPVPFLFFGPGIASNGAGRFSEKEAEKSRVYVDNAFTLMNDFIKSKRS